MTEKLSIKAKRLRRVYERDKGICHLCGRPVPHPNESEVPAGRTASSDHIIPRGHGGTDRLVNLRLAHELCNNLRGDRFLDECNVKEMLLAMERGFGGPATIPLGPLLRRPNGR